MKKHIFYFPFLLLFLSCGQDKGYQAENASEASVDISAAKSDSIFDPQKWQIKDGFNYPYRNRMLKDLMTDEDFRSLKRTAVLDLLGEPTKIDTNYLFYRVEEKRLGPWPFQTKTMVVKFTEDSLIEWIKIHE